MTSGVLCIPVQSDAAIITMNIKNHIKKNTAIASSMIVLLLRLITIIAFDLTCLKRFQPPRLYLQLQRLRVTYS